MELCSNGTLDDILKKGNVSWSKRWMWSLQITEALSYLHNEGVIHRDLKTENVLIDSEERAKLADLGISQVDVLLDKNEATIVTKGLQDKRFIAPENILIQSNYSSKKTDIYALGLVFWQISSCSVPNSLSAHKYKEWIKGNLIEREPIPLDCPESYKNLILKCWEFSAERRPTAKELVNYLRDLGHLYHKNYMLIEYCQWLETIIHPKRKEILSYLSPFVSKHKITENIDYYWRKRETTYINNSSKTERNIIISISFCFQT